MALAGDDLLANLVGGSAVGDLGQAFECEFFGGACAAACDDVAVNNHTVCKELLAIQLYFAAREAGAGSVLEEACLRKNCWSGADGKYPFALGVKLLENVGYYCRGLQVLDAGTTAGEAYCVKFRKLIAFDQVVEENISLDGEVVGAYDFHAVTDGGQSNVKPAALPVVKGCNEFCFFETICHKEKNVHMYLCFGEIITKSGEDRRIKGSGKVY